MSLLDSIIKVFVDGDQWCPIRILGTKCEESQWYASYHCCGEYKEECCMSVTVLGYFSMLVVAGVIIFIGFYLYNNRGRRCSMLFRGSC